MIVAVLEIYASEIFIYAVFQNPNVLRYLQ